MRIRTKKILIFSTLVLTNLFFGYIIGLSENADLYKYRPLEKVLVEMKQKKYDSENYNCLDYSEDMRTKLKDIGINSSIVIVDPKNKNGTLHAVVGVWFDGIDGDYAGNAEELTLYK